MILGLSALALLDGWEPRVEPMLKAGVRVALGPPPTPNRAKDPYVGSLTFQGIPVLVETARGQLRLGTDPSGKYWSCRLTAHYGEIPNTLGVDGDPVDVFVGPDANAPVAYVVHRKHPGTEVYDEDKVILGCRSLEEAEALFRANYNAPGNLAGTTPWPVDELREYLLGQHGRGARLDSPARVRLILCKARMRGAPGLHLDPAKHRWVKDVLDATTDELRGRLRSLDRPTSGRHHELLERLADHRELRDRLRSADLDTMKVADLKAHLRAFDRSTTGPRALLQGWLKSTIAREEGHSPPRKGPFRPAASERADDENDTRFMAAGRAAARASSHEREGALREMFEAGGVERETARSWAADRMRKGEPEGGLWHHVTSPERAAAIQEHGFAVGGGQMGEGVYLASHARHVTDNAVRKYGSAVVPAAVHGRLAAYSDSAPNEARAVLQAVHGSAEGGRLYDEHARALHTGGTNWPLLHSMVKKAGYDGLVKDHDGGARTALVYHPDRVKPAGATLDRALVKASTAAPDGWLPEPRSKFGAHYHPQAAGHWYPSSADAERAAAFHESAAERLAGPAKASKTFARMRDAHVDFARKARAFGGAMKKAEQVGLFGPRPAEPAHATTAPAGVVEVRQHVAHNPGGVGTHVVAAHQEHRAPAVVAPAPERKHVFEHLGKPPYRYVGLEHKVINVGGIMAPHYISGGTCDHCGTAISEMFHFISSDGKRFHVGSDCVNRADDEGRLARKIAPDLAKHRKNVAAKRAATVLDAALAAAEGQRPFFEGLPHPNPAQAQRGRTAADYIDWMLDNAGQKGRTEVAKFILAQLGLEKPGRRTSKLLKAVIRTPKGSDGKVDYDSVPVGASIWVSVSDPSSPLHGRPILITKRPDHQFALTGGSAAKHILARRHLVVSTGRGAKASAADEAKLQEAQEIEKRNAPVRARVREIRRQSKVLRNEAAKEWMSAVGVDQKELSAADRSKVVEAAQGHAKALGLEGRDAESFARHMADAVADQHDAHRRKLAAHRLEMARAIVAGHSAEEAAEIVGEPPKAPAIVTPHVDAETWSGLSEPEREHLIHANVEQQELRQELERIDDQRFETDPKEASAPQDPPATGPVETDRGGEDPRTEPSEEPADEATPFLGGQRPPDGGSVDPMPPDAPIGPTFALGGDSVVVNPEPEVPVEKPPPPPISPEAARKAIDAFRSLAAVRKAEKEALSQLERPPEIESALPSSVEDLRLRAGAVSDEELDAFLDEHRRQAMEPPDSAFYDALSPHWNETVGNKLAGATARGAATAISALVGDAAGVRMDVAKLADTLGPEAAAMAVVHRMREELPQDEFRAWVGKLRDHNATNQRETERKALVQHGTLQRQAETIERQMAAGDLQSQATTAMLLARNLLDQRENLGAALGSLQASAALYHFADLAQGAKKGGQPVVMTVGSKAALDDKLKRLGRVTSNVHYDVSRGVYQIHTTTDALRKLVSRTEADSESADRWRAVKNDRTNVVADAEGREWAAGYRVPGFRSHFGSVETLPVEQRHLAGRPIQLTADQRNDIEWLHGAGGGLVTRRTGAGKTLISAGVATKMLADNPKGRHLRIVPDGREEQWAQEISTFTHAPAVVLPAASTKEERRRILEAAPPGSVVIVGHTHAGRHDYDALATTHAWDSVGIDEPQELRSRSGSGKLSVGAKRIFKIPASNRHALTATPATDHPVEAYDIVNWARPRALGYRTRFERAFSGFGSGTNAQDAAVQRMLTRELEPHVSGEQLAAPHYAVDHRVHSVQMSERQLARQREIEAGADAAVAAAVDDALRKRKEGQRGFVDKSPMTLRREATERAMLKLDAAHRLNLSAGDVDTNPKLAQFRDAVAEADPADRHVVFVDSSDQRRAVTSLLEAMGHKGKIRNITSSAKGDTVKGPDGIEMPAIEARKQQWKEGTGGFLIIDRSSASGHNLAEGKHLHVLGAPDDAAQMLQAHGRLGRSNRIGDFGIRTYRYSDSPFEDLHWNKLDRQLKVLRAAAPAMFVEGKTREAPLEVAAKAVRRLLFRLGGRR